jgi:hypothetical protein
MKQFVDDQRGYGRNLSAKTLKSYKRMQGTVETWLGHAKPDDLMLWELRVVPLKREESRGRVRYDKRVTANWLPHPGSGVPETPTSNAIPHPYLTGATLQVGKTALSAAQKPCTPPKTGLGLAVSLAVGNQSVVEGQTPAELLGYIILGHGCALRVSRRELCALGQVGCTTGTLLRLRGAAPLRAATSCGLRRLRALMTKTLSRLRLVHALSLTRS